MKTAKNIQTTKKTIKQTAEEIREEIRNSTEAALNTVVTIYNLQTRKEKETKKSLRYNNQGFKGPEAKFFTKIAEAVLNGQELTNAEIELAQRKIEKYARQAARVQLSKSVN